jgi:hypothetical protein
MTPCFRKIFSKKGFLDLKDVIVEMYSDPAILECLTFSAEQDVVVDSQGMVFGRSWTSLGNGRKRREEAERLGALLQPMALWADEGEMDDAGNPIWLIVLVPLNISWTLARRSDCCFPVAYTYSGTDITDCIRYLLPQLMSLRCTARKLPGIAKLVYVSVEGICGDFPAIAKLTMRCQTAGSRYPCSFCLIDVNTKDGDKLLNDPPRWLNDSIPRRTQVCGSSLCLF